MSDLNPIRVMIVDDHGMVRRGLATYLKNDENLELVGEAGDPHGAHARNQRRVPSHPPSNVRRPLALGCRPGAADSQLVGRAGHAGDIRTALPAACSARGAAAA